MLLANITPYKIETAIKFHMKIGLDDDYAGMDFEICGYM